MGTAAPGQLAFGEYAAGAEAPAFLVPTVPPIQGTRAAPVSGTPSQVIQGTRLRTVTHG